MKEINMLWVDQDHIESWGTSFWALENMFDFKIETITRIKDKDVIEKCKDKDAVIIHCGTFEPILDVKELLEKIKDEYPSIKIGLQTNAIHPNLKELTDFYVYMPIRPTELQELLREQITRKG